MMAHCIFMFIINELISNSFSTSSEVLPDQCEWVMFYCNNTKLNIFYDIDMTQILHLNTIKGIKDLNMVYKP